METSEAKEEEDAVELPVLTSLFSRHVNERGNKTAVVYGDQSLSYRELDQHSNRLANWIVACSSHLHAAEETILIPFCLGGSIDQISVLVGILKAGGAYVPIDQNAPMARNEHILKDIKAKVLITNNASHAGMEKLIDSLSQQSVHLLNIDEQANVVEAAESEAPTAKVSSEEEAAYVLYTSGSTGKPKGVMVPRRGITRLVYQTNYFTATPNDCFVQAASISFDAATYEIWGALLNGARLVLVDKDVAVDSCRLRKVLEQERITLLFLTTSLFNHHVATNPSIFAGLRYVFFGGEACSTDAIRRLWEGKRPEKLLHVYGPTECTTFSTFYEIKSRPEEGAPVPIGSPISRTTCYVVATKTLELAPPGTTGELLVGGAGTALGYLNQPKISSEKFIPSPFNEGEILYRTGDVVKQREDGAIVFVGRIDQQVKVRGYRIELEEIELALDAIPAVLQAAVVTEDDGPGTVKRLVAYIRGEIDDLDPPSLRAYLEGTLPAYMVPSTFRVLSDFPLGLTGKIDRALLHQSNFKTLQIERELLEPRTPLEVELRELWASRLGVLPSSIGVNTDFFELGGDSLKAAAILGEAGRRAGIQIKMSQFLANPTVIMLATLVEGPQAIPYSRFVIPKVAHTEALPLGWAQEQIWLHQQIAPETVYYNEPLDINMPGRIDVPSLEQALKVLITRHEGLRARICWLNGRPSQRVEILQDFSLPLIDLRHLPSKLRLAEACHLATVQAKKVFDLDKDLLLRCLLVQLEDELFRLYITGHHLVLDGVGMFQVFLPELKQAYDAYCQGQEPQLPELSFRWRDWLVWQRSDPQRKEWEKQLEYWHTNLAGMQPLNLFTDRVRTANDSHGGARETLEIGIDLTQRLRDFARSQRTSLFVVLLGAFKTLLFRYTQQTDIAIGSVVAGRNVPGLEKHVCNTLNTLILRTQVAGTSVFADVLDSCRRTCYNAFANQDVPFQLVTGALPFQVAFVFEPGMPLENGGWEMNQLEIHTSTTKFDLTVELDQRDNKIIGRIEYSTDLYDKSTIQRMIHHYLHLLEAVVSDPICQVSNLPLLTPMERVQTFHGWNETKVNYNGPDTLHALIEQRAAMNPQAAAIYCGGQTVSFGELIGRARGVAHRLLQLNIHPNDTVGVWTERSADHIIGQLGVLQSGAAYVPLSPREPLERALLILNDAKVKAVLVDHATHAKLFEGYDVPQLMISSVEARDRILPPIPVGSDDLAYVIYTSGSTGKPKGVMIEHHSAVDRGLCVAADIRVNPNSRMLHVFSLNFDPCVLSTWWVLLAGAAVVMPTADELQSPQALLQLIHAHTVSHLVATPALWKVLAGPLEKANICLQWAGAGGDRFSLDLLQSLRKVSARITNYYGPTETTVLATAWEDDGVTNSPPPIGRPVANTSLYVLDPCGHPVPIGVPGELYIGGTGLGRGYLNLPRQTAAAFIANPFGAGRLYRTGDVVRWLETGEVQFLSRLDNQVKVRGFRVELGEIEEAIKNSTEAKECCVVVREEASGRKKLVAYVVGRTDRITLQMALRELLPDYMVPTEWVELSSLPLTINGKVDVKALPEPSNGTSSDDIPLVLPRNNIERKLHVIWMNVLQSPSISVHADFYEIGGDSLTALQVVALAGEQGLKVRLQDLMKCRTIEATAVGIAHQQHALRLSLTAPQSLQLDKPEKTLEVDCPFLPIQHDKNLVPFRTEGSLPPLFLVHPAGGNAMCYENLSSHLPHNQPVYGIDCADGYTGKTIPSMAATYMQAIRSKQPKGPYFIGGWSLGGIIAHEMALLFEAQGDHVGAVIHIDSRPLTHKGQSKYMRLMYESPAFLLSLLTRHLSHIAKKEVNISYEELAALPHDEADEWFIQKLVSDNIFPDSLRSFVQRFVEDFRATCGMAAECPKQGVCRAQIILFRALEISQPHEGFVSLEEPFPEEGDQTYGWNSYSEHSVVVHPVPGSHETLVFPPHAVNLAEMINVSLIEIFAEDQLVPRSLEVFSAAQWQEFLQHVDMISLQPGGMLVREGDVSRELYILVEGTLEVKLNAETRIVIHPSTIIGENGFIDGQPRTATVCAQTEAIVYCLTRSGFQLLQHDASDLAIALLMHVTSVLASRYRAILKQH